MAQDWDEQQANLPAVGEGGGIHRKRIYKRLAALLREAEVQRVV